MGDLTNLKIMLVSHIRQISIKNNWDKLYTNKKHLPWDIEGKKLLDFVWRRYNLPKNANILDLGCGRGKKSYYLNSQGHKTTGIDISEVAIEEANKNNQSRLKCKFYKSDIYDYLSKCEDKEFDVILDLVSSQFLTEKADIFKQVLPTKISDKGFYILSHFVNTKLYNKEEIPEWIKNISRDKEDIVKRYSNSFRLIFFESLLTRQPSEVGIFLFQKI